MELEDEFDVNIPDEEAQKMQTVGDAVNYIWSTPRKNKRIQLLFASNFAKTLKEQRLRSCWL